MSKKILTGAIGFQFLLILSSCGFLISKYVRQASEQELGGGGATEAFAPNYDPETVLTVTGSVDRAEDFQAKPLLVKSVRIFLKTKDQTWEAHLGPVWYIKKQPFRLVPGDVITITGSRIGDKIMIQQFEKKGQTFQLRSKEGQPKWFKSVIRETEPGIQGTEKGN
jgi:hypothetical protein